MANWNGMLLTGRGRKLQAKVEAGAVLKFSKMKIGSGNGSADIETLRDLVKPKQTIGIDSVTAQEDGLCKVSGIITNVGLKEGYYVAELGVFAVDPDEGEILYAYTSDNAPDYLAAEGGQTAYAQEFDIYIAISNDTNVEAVIDPASLASKKWVQDYVKIIGKDGKQIAGKLGLIVKFTG